MTNSAQEHAMIIDTPDNLKASHERSSWMIH